jgi:hypothetical protein
MGACKSVKITRSVPGYGGHAAGRGQFEGMIGGGPGHCREEGVKAVRHCPAEDDAHPCSDRDQGLAGGTELVPLR